jgi:uncharacterized membrane protein HdeD (DUF308 family)
MKPINFVMGLIAIGAGAYALYLTIAEQRMATRPSTATRIARAVVGLVALIVGVLAILSATGVIFRTPTPYAVP